MSLDPETARQIEELSHDDRPLLVLDVDDVLIEFIRPFPNYLKSKGYELRLETFRLHGNIFETATDRPVERELASELIDGFYASQADWQTMTEGASDALASFANAVEIVLLTAMPHRHRDVRRRHLRSLGLDYPLLTTEASKGPAIAALRGPAERAVAFVDDMPNNLASVGRHVPEAHLFHLMADNSLRELMPPIEIEGLHIVEDWRDAQPKIARALGVPT
ncbi:MAG: hypothetical protein JJ913_01755 [Rhizobiaceae bacterium]|nr:hypothetical protein [Rhizobiaceae bacterium]